MEKAKEKLDVRFDSIISTLSEQGNQSFIDKVKVLREDMYKVLSIYNPENDDDWNDVEERLEDLTKAYETFSSSNDLKVITGCFALIRKKLDFEKNLLRVLDKTESESWSQDDIRPAILKVLRRTRVEIKSKQDTSMLESYDELKDDIKKIISGKYTDFKYDKYRSVKKELRADLWKNDKNMQFISQALYFYMDNLLKEQIAIRLNVFKSSCA